MFIGWIRYSERVLGSLVTPHICTARSPQQVMGCLVKNYFSKQQVNIYYQSSQVHLVCWWYHYTFLSPVTVVHIVKLGKLGNTKLSKLSVYKF